MSEEKRLVYAVVKHDYDSVDAQELSISKGDRLVVLDDSCQWWKVENSQGLRGVVPSNYLKKCKPSLFQSLKKKVKANKRTSKSLRLDDGVITMNDDSSTLDSGRAVAIYSYKAQKPDEISLMKGDSLIVQTKSNDGWWNGRKENGESGWFPSNYVQVSCVTSESLASLDDNNRMTMGGSNDELMNRYVIALFNYAASNCDELSFVENERLEIVENISTVNGGGGACAKGWLMARSDQGSMGLIPEAYVQPMSSSDLSCTPSTTLSPSCGGSMSFNSIGEVLNLRNLDVSKNSAITSASSDDIRQKQETSSSFRLTEIGRDWYYGRITRQECEQSMIQSAENGDFVVRASETHVGEFTLTMKTKQLIKHFRIKFENGIYLIGQQEFESLDSLVEHYKKHAIYRLGNDKLFLNKAFKLQQM